jgi:DNA transformation protein and related proteins
MTALRDLRNIGSVCAAELEAAGIKSGEELRAVGSLGAAIRLRAAGFDVCRSKLAGLEGAIRGMKWNLVPPETRERLWGELEEATKL